MSRLALSDSDKAARDWFASTASSLGCALNVDEMGNMFAVRPGRHNDEPPTYAGSHLDTQPAGGRYDGILGVVAGLELLSVLKDHQVETEYPVGVINWTNEEGARFPTSMMSSGVWSGDIPVEHAHNMREVGGGDATVRSELQRIGYLGSTPASYDSTPMSAHFELHIEQGPILERAEQKIGVVEGAQAYRWYTIDVEGRDAHTGTTPYDARSDALFLASSCLTYAQRTALTSGALATTGILKVSPGSTNTIPGHVSFSLDLRAPKDETVQALEEHLKIAFDELASKEGVRGTDGKPVGLPGTVSWRTDSVSTAVRFDDRCIAAVEKAAKAAIEARPEVIGDKRAADLLRRMVSGAGHDSVYTSRRCPTSMIFVPCRDGVLLGAVLNWDRGR